MSPPTLTETRLQQGVWQGILTMPGGGRPELAVHHHDTPVAGIELTHDPDQGHWLLQVPIPREAISDGVQTLTVTDTASDTRLGHITLLAGEVLGDDIRAEMDLLRAELDMLKRAFRRHCLETQ